MTIGSIALAVFVFFNAIMAFLFAYTLASKKFKAAAFFFSICALGNIIFSVIITALSK